MSGDNVDEVQQSYRRPTDREAKDDHEKNFGDLHFLHVKATAACRGRGGCERLFIVRPNERKNTEITAVNHAHGDEDVDNIQHPDVELLDRGGLELHETEDLAVVFQEASPAHYGSQAGPEASENHDHGQRYQSYPDAHMRAVEVRFDYVEEAVHGRRSHRQNRDQCEEER